MPLTQDVFQLRIRRDYDTPLNMMGYKAMPVKVAAKKPVLQKVERFLQMRTKKVTKDSDVLRLEEILASPKAQGEAAPAGEQQATEKALTTEQLKAMLELVDQRRQRVGNIYEASTKGSLDKLADDFFAAFYQVLWMNYKELKENPAISELVQHVMKCQVRDYILARLGELAKQDNGYANDIGMGYRCGNISSDLFVDAFVADDEKAGDRQTLQKRLSQTKEEGIALFTLGQAKVEVSDSGEEDETHTDYFQVQIDGSGRVIPMEFDINIQPSVNDSLAWFNLAAKQGKEKAQAHEYLAIMYSDPRFPADTSISKVREHIAKAFAEDKLNGLEARSAGKRAKHYIAMYHRAHRLMRALSREMNENLTASETQVVEKTEKVRQEQNDKAALLNIIRAVENPNEEDMAIEFDESNVRMHFHGILEVDAAARDENDDTLVLPLANRLHRSAIVNNYDVTTDGKFVALADNLSWKDQIAKRQEYKSLLITFLTEAREIKNKLDKEQAKILEKKSSKRTDAKLLKQYCQMVQLCEALQFTGELHQILHDDSIAMSKKEQLANEYREYAQALTGVSPLFKQLAAVMLALAGVALMLVSVTHLALTFGLSSAIAVSGIAGGVACIVAGSGFFANSHLESRHGKSEYTLGLKMDKLGRAAFSEIHEPNAEQPQPPAPDAEPPNPPIQSPITSPTKESRRYKARSQAPAARRIPAGIPTLVQSDGIVRPTSPVPLPPTSQAKGEQPPLVPDRSTKPGQSAAKSDAEGGTALRMSRP